MCNQLIVNQFKQGEYNIVLAYMETPRNFFQQNYDQGITVIIWIGALIRKIMWAWLVLCLYQALGMGAVCWPLTSR